MKLKIGLWLALLAGTALFVCLIVYEGIDEVAAAFAAAGWGVAVIGAYHITILAAQAMAWGALVPRDCRPSFPALWWMRWLGNSVNQLLPVASIGGEIVRARLLAQSGVPGAVAGAGVVADMTAGLATQGVFALLGVATLALHGGRSDSLPVVIGLGGVAVLLYAFYRAQRSGLFERLAHVLEKGAGGRDLTALTGGAAALDRAIAQIYARPSRFFWCCLWRLVAWSLFAVETWLVLRMLGHPISLAEAFIVESLVQAMRTAGFMIPGALGVQEGGYLALGALVGVPTETALAVSLVKRVRDLILSLPGLAAWQWYEVSRLRRLRAAGRPPGAAAKDAVTAGERPTDR